MKGFPKVFQKIKKLSKSKQFLFFVDFTVPVIFLSLFIFSIFIYLSITVFIESQIVPQAPFQLPQPVDYPKLNLTAKPNISAQAAIIMDNDSKTIVFAKNPDLRFSPASTTKIMTALVGLNNYKMDQTLVIKYIDPEGVHVGFFIGEKLSFKDILYAMLLPSSNDAALAIAQNFPGGEDLFIKNMNSMAQKYHLQNTFFSDPVGITDDQTYTTVSDLSKLASIAIENPIFAQVVNTKSTTIYSSDKSFEHNIKNINQLLGLYGVDGIKTGFTEEAKEVLVTSVNRNGHKFIIVVMKSDDRFADTRTLIQEIVDNTSFLSIHF